MVARAVFLDRDGVLNANIMRDGKQVAPWRLEDFKLLPGVTEAVRSLKVAGFDVVVVTNQPDIATGRTNRAVLDAMHSTLSRDVPVDAIKVCVHLDSDACACRKPKPGMLLEAAVEREIALRESYLIGDRWRDIGAGHAAGCTSILVGDWDGDAPSGMQPAFETVSSLPEAVRIILHRERDGVRI